MSIRQSITDPEPLDKKTKHKLLFVGVTCSVLCGMLSFPLGLPFGIVAIYCFYVWFGNLFVIMWGHPYESTNGKLRAKERERVGGYAKYVFYLSLVLLFIALLLLFMI